MYSPGYDCPGIYVAAVFGFPQPYAARVYACPGVVGRPGVYVATTFGFLQPYAARVYACPGVEGVPGYVFPPGIHGLSALSLFISWIFFLPGYGQGRPGFGSPAVISPSLFLYLFSFVFVSFLFYVFLCVRRRPMALKAALWPGRSVPWWRRYAKQPSFRGP